jgi:hypothetical protein
VIFSPVPDPKSPRALFPRKAPTRLRVPAIHSPYRSQSLHSAYRAPASTHPFPCPSPVRPPPLATRAPATLLPPRDALCSPSMPTPEQAGGDLAHTRAGRRGSRPRRARDARLLAPTVSRPRGCGCRQHATGSLPSSPCPGPLLYMMLLRASTGASPCPRHSAHYRPHHPRPTSCVPPPPRSPLSPPRARRRRHRTFLPCTSVRVAHFGMPLRASGRNPRTSLHPRHLPHMPRAPNLRPRPRYNLP